MHIFVFKCLKLNTYNFLFIVKSFKNNINVLLQVYLGI